MVKARIPSKGAGALAQHYSNQIVPRLQLRTSNYFPTFLKSGKTKRSIRVDITGKYDNTERDINGVENDNR